MGVAECARESIGVTESAGVKENERARERVVRRRTQGEDLGGEVPFT